MTSEVFMDIIKEMEDHLDNINQQETFQFINSKENIQFDKNLIVVEALGNHGLVDQLISNEIQGLSKKITKLAGLYSNYLSEMIQVQKKEIILPISILKCDLLNSKSIIFVTTNFAIPDVVSYSIAEKLHEWYTKNGLKKIIIIDGVQSKKDILNHTITTFGYSNGVFNGLESANTDLNIVGPTAGSLITYINHKDISLKVFLIESNKDYDPHAALNLFERMCSLEQFEDLKDHISELREKAESNGKKSFKRDITGNDGDSKTPYFV